MQGMKAATSVKSRKEKVAVIGGGLSGPGGGWGSRLECPVVVHGAEPIEVNAPSKAYQNEVKARERNEIKLKLATCNLRADLTFQSPRGSEAALCIVAFMHLPSSYE